MRRSLLLGPVVILVLTACGATEAPPAADATATTATTTSSAPAEPAPTTVSTSPSTSTPPPPTLQSAFEKVRTGVVRFEVARCDGSGQGSGFALSPTLFATVAHVVDEGQVIRVVQGTRSAAGTVIGLEQGTDVALVRTAAPMKGHAFDFSDTAPRVGDQVAALGFPRGQPLGFNPGTVNGLGRKADIEGYTRYDLLELDAATHPGSSGGPVIRADGEVVGLVDAQYRDPETGAADQGRRLAVSSATAEPLISDWSAQPEPAPLSDCTGATYEDGSPVPEEEFPTRADRQAITTLRLYFGAINGGDFATALAQLINPGSLEDFQESVASTRDDDIEIQSLQETGTQVVAWVTFTSSQDPGKGPAERPEETCTRWSLDYVLAPANGLWLIDTTRAHAGAPHAPCDSQTPGELPTTVAPPSPPPG